MAPVNINYFTKRSVESGLPVLVGVVVGGLALSLLVLILCTLFRRRQQQSSRSNEQASSNSYKHDKQASSDPRTSYSQLLLALEGAVGTPIERAENIINIKVPTVPPKAVVVAPKAVAAPFYELAPIPRSSPFPLDHSLLQASQFSRASTPSSHSIGVHSIVRSASVNTRTSMLLSVPHSRGNSPYDMAEVEKDDRLLTISSRDNLLSTEGLLQQASARKRDDSPIPPSAKSWTSFLPGVGHPERVNKRSTLIKRPPPTSFRIISKPIPISHPTPAKMNLPPSLSAIKAFADSSSVHAARYPELRHPRRRMDLVNLPGIPQTPM